jgi:hypothetical protein
MIVIYSIKIRVIPRLVKLICIKWLEESAPTNLGKIPDVFSHRESGFGRQPTFIHIRFVFSERLLCAR